MKKQIFYTFKFKSSRLEEFNYDIQNLDTQTAKKSKEIISMFDSQLLRSISKLTNRTINIKEIHNIKKQINKIKIEPHSKDNAKKINDLQTKIDDILFVPEIISIVIENRNHYKYLYKNGLKLNGKLFRRFSSSAGQARSSTVLFCETSTADKLDKILNNGRNEKKELVPSKFNAYKGLVTSSTTVVSTPRFCLIPDYNSFTDVEVNFVTETDVNEDDEIKVKMIREKFNRFDGQGIISIEMATQWAKEMGLDYVPSQWCIRQNYTKGMLTTFDIKAFCKEINAENYMIQTSYKDELGNYKMADLNNIDVILSESQFKLWDSFSSIEEYKDNCRENGLQWGVSLISPKKDKDILKMNYQFLQTLRIKDADIETLCRKFVHWICGVNSEDINYTLLFLLGTDVDEEGALHYFETSDNHWIKALMVDKQLINDKWVKKKIYDMVKRKIKNGCLGQILVDGNFQVIVSDPFAMMQHACGLEVTGLLNKNEHYSGYWNKKNVKVVDSMRAPLTYRSEHVLLNLQNNEKLNYWYKHNQSGIIVNVHGAETMQWAGSDFDMDIIATTSDETIIKGVYKDELPIAYEPPKSKPKVLKDRDLYNADLHSFGSEIGQITNKSTSGYALLAQLDENSQEYHTTMNRIKMCTKLQSAQIDKAKIGRKVKSIPKIWMHYNRINSGDPEKVKLEKDFLNRTLLNKHPYFFTYLYKGTRKKYRNHYNNQDATCQQRFGVSLAELLKQKRNTPEQMEFISTFNKYSPVIDSDCVMNKICKYIEKIDFGIRNIVKQEVMDGYHKRLMHNENLEIDKDTYKKIQKAYSEFKSLTESIASANANNKSTKSDYNEELKNEINIVYEEFKTSLSRINSNTYEIVDYLIHMFYVDKHESNKEVLWSIYGDYIFKNVKNKFNSVTIPVPNEEGNIEYLNKKYKLKEVVFADEQVSI